MKKLLFLFVLIAIAVQVKAQARFELKPFGKAPDSFAKPFKYNFGDSLTRIFPQNPNFGIQQNTGTNKVDVGKQYAYNPMPVVRMEGRSNMPVVKMPGNSKMPVVNPDAGEIPIRRSTAP